MEGTWVRKKIEFQDMLCLYLLMLACFVQYVKRGSTHVEMPSLKYIKKRINSANFEVRFARTCVKNNNENIQDNLQQI